MSIADLLIKYRRIFIIPIDHPLGEDSKQLAKIGKQSFVDLIDYLDHDGYIFHARDYVKKPFNTRKDFFLTVGEKPDKYLCDLKILEKYPHIKHLTIYFNVRDKFDNTPLTFYQDYVRELKKRKYFVMSMGFPEKRPVADISIYHHIADIAKRLDCDALKTDLFDGIDKLDLKGMKLFIGGGPFIITERDFVKFINDVEKLKTASCSIGRNIFEAKNYQERIKSVLNVFHPSSS